MKLDKPGTNQEVYALWECHWQGDDARRLTVVGELITKAKRKGLGEIVGRLNCRRAITRERAEGS